MSEYSGISIKDLTSKAIRALRSSQYDEAVEITTEIIERDDTHASAHAIQFSSLFKSKKFEQARRMGGLAAQLNPKSVFILNNQACLQLEAKQPAAAAGLLKSLIDQFGERGQWLYNLALAQRMVGNFEYAIKMFRRTLDHQPEHDRAAFQLADCLKVVGHHEQAVSAFDYVRLLRSKHAPTHSNFIHHSANNNNFTQSDLDQELALWLERFIPKDRRYNVDQPSDALKLKIGFTIGAVPGDWLQSIVIPVINQLSRGEDSVSVYWHNENAASGLFEEPIDVTVATAMSDADFARKVRAGGIDVMVDVCGMRIGARQRSLGLHLCGRQFGWLAHEGAYATPLVSIIDDMLGTQRFYVAPNESPPTPAPKNIVVGIGSKSGLPYEVIKSWAYIMHQLEGHSLLLDAGDQHVIKVLKERFKALGVTNDRLVFDTSKGPGEGSIVLDNFVSNEIVSASHALEAGGILVALKGPLFPAQQTAALLEQVERGDWLCSSTAEYVQRAISLADGALAEPLSAEDFEMSRVRNIQTFVTLFRNTISS